MITDENKQLKYQSYIDKAISDGAIMPELMAPEDKLAYRFVFSENPEKNHIPVCVMNPKRILPNDVLTSGYALSCFGDENKAAVRYMTLKKSFKMIAKTIGDALAEGILKKGDGLITLEAESTSHFDFYEFEECNPAAIFTTKTKFV